MIIEASIGIYRHLREKLLNFVKLSNSSSVSWLSYRFSGILSWDLIKYLALISSWKLKTVTSIFLYIQQITGAKYVGGVYHRSVNYYSSLDELIANNLRFTTVKLTITNITPKKQMLGWHPYIYLCWASRCLNGLIYLGIYIGYWAASCS